MERERKILVAILALLVLSSVVAIVNIAINVKSGKVTSFHLKKVTTGPGIGIVRVEGPIDAGDSGHGFKGSAGAENIVRRLDNLSKDRNIKAIVLRINSPGGTVAASQEIYNKLMKLRGADVPVIASMADVAASGGYYIASACNRIFANQGTITGSIGVITVSPNMKRLFEKLGISWNVIKSGKYKDILASHRDLTDEERKLIQRTIDSSYERFISDVARSRNLDISALRAVADGRIMNGDEALRQKLIDEIGGFEEAIAHARKLGGLPENSPLYEETGFPLQDFFMSLDGIMGKLMSIMGPLPEERIGIEYR